MCQCWARGWSTGHASPKNLICYCRLFALDYIILMAHSWLSALLGLFCAISATADDVALVRITDSWRYFKGTSAPPTNWPAVTFTDSAWLTGYSAFSRAYGGATDVSDSYGRYTSLFCRRAFTVSDLSQVRWLVLRVDYDSGLVVFLNGQEVARRGLGGTPGEPVAHTAVAVEHAAGTPELIDLSAHIALLNPGTNVLAIQAHTSNLSDYNFYLAPELLANFIRGPFIQNSATNQTQVLWRTHLPAWGAVEYGPTPALGLTVTNETAGTNCILTLTNLQPGTTYYYRAVVNLETNTARSPIESFTTLKSGGDLCFAVFGDSGAGTVPQYEVAQVIGRTSPDLVLHTGDIIYNEFTAGRTDLRCLSVHGPVMRQVPFYFTYGNHDLYDPLRGDQNFAEAFSLPTNNVTGTEHFYSFDHGDAHFVSLFVPFLGQYSQYPQYAFTNQYHWLTNDLAQSAKPWKILFFHAPPRTSAPHRFDPYNGEWYAREVIEQMILPVAREYGVQIIFNGHDHDYERLGPVDGVHFVVTGGGGAGLYSVSELDEASSQFYHRYHCVRVAITNGTLTLEGIDRTGTVFDSMTIRPTPPERSVHNSALHSVTVNPPPANSDGDGNFNGQVFDFVGAPVSAVSGRNANLGQVWINNDATHLYVGLENAMIRAHQAVFLFIESPAQAGVSNLLGLGNGVIDPDGQGADGLDYLENLSFSNFAPSVACVLGDEYADTQSRSFKRAAMPSATGQGVFRLNATLDDVPGARMQQFNRRSQSPDASNQSVPYEVNADFMVVAIPLSQVGNPEPGATLKVGVLVGGSQVDVPQQWLALDTGFAGASFAGGDFAPAVLEGLSVKLTVPPLQLFIAPVLPGQFQLSWFAEPGKKYDLEYSPALTNLVRWPEPGFPRTATSRLESVILTPPAGNQGFFRVKEVP